MFPIVIIQKIWIHGSISNCLHCFWKLFFVVMNVHVSWVISLVYANIQNKLVLSVVKYKEINYEFFRLIFIVFLYTAEYITSWYNPFVKSSICTWIKNLCRSSFSTPDQKSQVVTFIASFRFSKGLIILLDHFIYVSRLTVYPWPQLILKSIQSRKCILKDAEAQ